ncbi:MAG: hypothetical protein M1830_007389 [Pleopsidium flavum]|nr:MAG: hypothetical protein M1830_007389 [Pleopsidium flavum]
MGGEEKGDLVYGDDGYISDESSFYGDDELRSRLEDVAFNFDPSSYWSTQHLNLSSIAASNIAAAAKEKAAGKLPNHKFYNPYEGLVHARQLAESVPDFLQRLPPLTTSASTNGPWIYIANPHSAERPLQQDLAGLVTTGESILSSFSAKIAAVETQMAGRPKTTITRKLTPERKAVEDALLAAAKDKNCTSGKWMLFPMPENLARTWRLVATATAQNELGTAAKVAADEGRGDRVPRLICVYTRDFADMGDVKRVLGKLVELELVQKPARDPKGMRSIYYKCDAYTHLGINSGNEWALKASLYSSRDVLLTKE